MITLRKASDRGRTRLDWLDSRHTFSFGDYFDPDENGFSVLRVINDDRVAGGGGFPTHPHRDMEIITYVLEGAVEHRDSLGTRSVIPAGDLQRMTAGTGITHSEFNPSPSAPLHFLQIWIIPERHGLEPGYEQKSIDGGTHSQLSLVAARIGRRGVLTVHQDVKMYIGTLGGGRTIEQPIGPNRTAYLHVAGGEVSLNGIALEEGSGAKIVEERQLRLSAPDNGKVLLLDLP